MSDEVPEVLLGAHLKALKLPTFLREHHKLARQCAVDEDHLAVRAARDALGVQIHGFDGQPAWRQRARSAGLQAGIKAGRGSGGEVFCGVAHAPIVSDPSLTAPALRAWPRACARVARYSGK